MGCVASKPDINDHHHNIFQVVNVDDLGHRFTAAKLEVTEGELILHQRGKTATHWPLRCLRRYGFDADLFSFESGRRCPTGPGIYAFKCRRAEALFNLLQQQIQNITEDAAAAPPPPQQDLLDEITHTLSNRTVLGELRTSSLNEHRGLNEHRATLNEHRNPVPASEPDVYLEPKPRPASMRHPSVGSGTPGSNNVLSRIGGSMTPNQGGGGMTVGACTGIGSSGSFSGGGCGVLGGGCIPGGATGFTNTHSSYNNNNDRSASSLGFRPSVDRVNSTNGTFLYADASESSGTGGLGGAGGGGTRSPASPPAPPSNLPPVTYYDERSDDTPPTPGRDPPPTPTDNPHVVCLNQRTNTVTYEPQSTGRPMSFPSCQPANQLNSNRRPTRPYVDKMKLYENNRSELLYENVGPGCDRSRVYVNLVQDKAEGPAVPPRSSLVPPSGACGGTGGVCGVVSSGCNSIRGLMRPNGCNSITSGGNVCGPLVTMGGCGSLGPGGSGCGSGSSTTDTDQQASVINYIMVELEQNSDSSVVVPTSPQGSVTSGPDSPHHSTVENYVKIDIDKTMAIDKALSLSSNKSQGPWEPRDDGLRKTRHNSTFSSPVVLLRNNSSLSD